MARQDYLCDDAGDLLFKDGDLVVGDSDEQHIKDIIELNKGGDRENILLGADAIKFVKSSGRRNEFVAAVKSELKADSYNGVQIEFLSDRLDDFIVKV